MVETVGLVSTCGRELIRESVRNILDSTSCVCVCVCAHIQYIHTWGPPLTNSIRSRGLVVTQVGRMLRQFFP
jgi:hypothetical protein